MVSRFWLNVGIGAGALVQNKLRAFLTSLGVVFGVASVIAMFAIVEGANQKIAEGLRLLGTDNVLIRSVPPEKESESSGSSGSALPGKKKQPYSPGLTLADLQSISATLPGVAFSVPETGTDIVFAAKGRYIKGNIVGVSERYPEAANLKMASGKCYSSYQVLTGQPVCFIGAEVGAKLFTGTDPVGQMIKCGNEWMRIIGVLESKNVSSSQQDKLGVRNYNSDVFIPITTYLLRIQNRNLVTQYAIQKLNSDDDDENKEKLPLPNYHQLDKITVRMKNTSDVRTASEVIRRMLFRRHREVADFEVTIAEEMLKQKKKNEDLFNNVLLALASISLLVGGIGIMNIMLASVVERTKEIGIRLSLGAEKGDILLQFISEAVMMSLGGGLIGIGLGLSISFLVREYQGIPATVGWFPVLLSFGVSAAVGLIFGILPARRAASRDPITSLRYE